MNSLRNQGLSVTALMPLASDAQWRGGRWHSERVSQLRASSSFEFPASALCTSPEPHPTDVGARPIDAAAVLENYQVLATWADSVVIDGVGNPDEPLAPSLTLGDLAQALKLPVIMVCEDNDVSLQASCALVARCRARGMWVAGWVRLGQRPLTCVAGIPLLGVIPVEVLADPVQSARHLDAGRLLDVLQPEADRS